MNIAMEQTEEYVHGQLKAKYGDCFIRGNNGESPAFLLTRASSSRYSCRLPLYAVLYIATQKRR